MEKYWEINGNKFFTRKNAKEFLIIKWSGNPASYLDDDDVVYYFNEYLEEHEEDPLGNWLLKLTNATETQLKEMQNFF